jgi:acyl carrier protein
MSDQTLVLREYLPLPQPYVGPGTPTETSLAEIWRTVLSMDRVGIHDGYPDLGGDSFHAAIIFAQIEAVFGLQLPLASLVSAATIAQLAARIDRLRQGR